MARPFIKWVGGKTQLLEDLNRLAPPKFNKYFEPFLGGGAFYFALGKERTAGAILNDFNPHLAELYTDVRDNIDKLIVELKKVQKHYLSDSDHETRRGFYLEYRHIYNNLDSCIYKSALFLFLNKTGFNGIYRVNPKGEYNVPFGRNNHKTVYDETVLREASMYLQSSTISHGSYENAITHAQKGDFIYLDPPYIPLTKTSKNFTNYTVDGFDIEDQKKLRDAFVALHKKGCLVMLSNSNANEVQELYKDFNQHEVLANRAVNCKATGRGKIKELVITSY